MNYKINSINSTYLIDSSTKHYQFEHSCSYEKQSVLEFMTISLLEKEGSI